MMAMPICLKGLKFNNQLARLIRLIQLIIKNKAIPFSRWSREIRTKCQKFRKTKTSWIWTWHKKGNRLWPRNPKLVCKRTSTWLKVSKWNLRIRCLRTYLLDLKGPKTWLRKRYNTQINGSNFSPSNQITKWIWTVQFLKTPTISIISLSLNQEQTWTLVRRPKTNLPEALICKLSLLGRTLFMRKASAQLTKLLRWSTRSNMKSISTLFRLLTWKLTRLLKKTSGMIQLIQSTPRL